MNRRNSTNLKSQNAFASFARMKEGFDILEAKQSNKYKAQVFFEEGCLCIYLPTGKALSKTEINKLTSIGWQYEEAARRVLFEAPDINELLTHENKTIREQATRHTACMTKNSQPMSL